MSKSPRLFCLAVSMIGVALFSGCPDPSLPSNSPSPSASPSPEPQTTPWGSFADGADVGWLSQLENRGVTWYDSTNVKTDALALLKSAGVDSIRLRVMANPGRYNYNYYSGGGTSGTISGLLGYCDQNGVVAMAKRAKALGLRVMVDFHFSDTWASGGNQAPPLAWNNYTLGEMSTAVFNHVNQVLSALKSVGVIAEWVQIGNEIPNGLLFGAGSSGYVSGSAGWANLVSLLNSGYDATKAVNSSTKVIIHLDRGGNNSLYRWWFDAFKAAGGKWDVIGMSFYPYWQPADTVAMLQANLNDMASRYGKEVMVCEVGGPDSDPSGTKTLVTNVVAAVKAVPNGAGLGVFYWEPEANQAVLPGGYSLGASTVKAPNQLYLNAAVGAL